MSTSTSTSPSTAESTSTFPGSECKEESTSTSAECKEHLTELKAAKILPHAGHRVAAAEALGVWTLAASPRPKVSNANAKLSFI